MSPKIGYESLGYESHDCLVISGRFCRVFPRKGRVFGYGGIESILTFLKVLRLLRTGQVLYRVSYTDRVGARNIEPMWKDSADPEDLRT